MEIRAYFPLNYRFGQKRKVGNSIKITYLLWLRGKDSNQRPPGYEGGIFLIEKPRKAWNINEESHFSSTNNRLFLPVFEQLWGHTSPNSPQNRRPPGAEYNSPRPSPRSSGAGANRWTTTKNENFWGSRPASAKPDDRVPLFIPVKC